MDGDEGFPSRPFLLFWRAEAVSGFGSYITLLALQTLVVLTLHGSTTEVGCGRRCELGNRPTQTSSEGAARVVPDRPRGGYARVDHRVIR